MKNTLWGIFVLIVILPVIAGAIEKNELVSVSLEATDWLYRGAVFNVIGFEDSPIAYIEIDRNNSDSDLMLVDYSNPQELKHVKTIQGFGSGFIGYQHYLIGFTNAKGLVVWDVSNPLEPEEIASYPEWKNLSDMNGVVSSLIGGCFNKGYFYYLNWSTLYIYDFLDVSQVKAVATVKTPMKSGGICRAEGNRLVVFNQYVGDFEVTIFDISNPQNPQFANRFQFHDKAGEGYGSGFEDLVLIGNYMILGFNGGGNWLYVYDISDPANPVKISTYQEPGETSSIYGTRWIKDDLLFVTFYQSDLRDTYGRVMRLNPSGVLEPYSEECPVPCSDIRWTTSRFVFTADFYYDLSLIDLRDMKKPKVSSIDQYPELREFVVDGD